MVDIYFNPNYGRLCEDIEKGKSEVFKFENEYGNIQHMFIKREIPTKINEETYYDLITPYGYGGPVIINCEDKKRDNLINSFVDEFQNYCYANNIVSEFVRFHPILDNARDFNEYYTVSHIRNTVGTDLANFEQPFVEEFSKSCRKKVRNALRDGVSYKITEKPNDIGKFKQIYYSTMDRNNASEFYYFDDTYFNKCLEYFPDNLLLVEAIYEDKTIAMGFYFVYENYIHIHLSGTLNEYLSLSPAYILRYAVTEWGKENGYKLIHHGGGRSNDPEDTLYQFKKRFGKNTDFGFHIGKKIWNESIYKQLCKMNNIDKEIDFFPAYRFEV
ncbi:GNAT family N-acetyltransferase [Bacillus sp. B15-48]|uniref:GNAT family N-acetyltransferase n=1 Tax=Bacillus sp. B15-48 TaxID=1548601 RepID=UPI00194004DA|nr:GNAT family N-acetyltransferase [Bacillus sp. B15-48]MBM4761462.1 peptidoglycan bridge formation glycyltransferase FemA/FemB family protein [Bacillus sp. B15-48]